MFGFWFRKNFYDLWDNLFRIALLNVGFIASAAFTFLVPSLFISTMPAGTTETPIPGLEIPIPGTGMPIIGMVVFIIGILWCLVYLAAAALTLKSTSDNTAFGFAEFFSNIKKGWPWGLATGVMLLICYLMVTEVIPFYLRMNSLVGLLLAAIIFWTMIGGFLSLQFFFAVRARLDTKLKKVIKKCFLIFIDNTGFCIFAFLIAIIMLAVSFFTAFLFPGPAGILLFLDEGLRLRIMKYDWLEANPGANRRKIPWEAILVDEREKTGTRSFRNFIFPWKD